MKKLILFCNIILLLICNADLFAAAYLTPKDIVRMPIQAPTAIFHYGKEKLQYGELRMPSGKGPFPLVIIIHGGCWLSQMATTKIMSPLATAITKEGIATWSIEYRGVDVPGGRWPGTYNDANAGIQYINKIAKKYNLDLNKVIILGHSAGGELALWEAAKTKLPIRGVIDLSGPGNLPEFYPLQMHTCGADVVTQLMHGSPTQNPSNYKKGSPSELLPLGVKQILITGAEDIDVPSYLAQSYAQAAQKAGDTVQFIEVKNAAHFEMVSPSSTAWPVVNKAILELLN